MIEPLGSSQRFGRLSELHYLRAETLTGQIPNQTSPCQTEKYL